MRRYRTKPVYLTVESNAGVRYQQLVGHVAINEDDPDDGFLTTVSGRRSSMLRQDGRRSKAHVQRMKGLKETYG